MNWQVTRKSWGTLIVVGLVMTMLLSAAGVATAAYQPVDTQSNTIELRPTEAAGDATAKFTYDVETRDDGALALISSMTDYKGLDEDFEVSLVDDEGNSVSLGVHRMDESNGATPLEGGKKNPIENFQNYDSVEISRVSDQEVLFTGDLP